MRFFLHKPGSNVFSPELVQKVHGVFLKYKISSAFAMGGGWSGSFAHSVKKDIEYYKYMSKKVALSVQWGAACGNVVWNGYPYIELVERHHEGTGPPVYNKFPVPYNENYLLLVRSFLEYLRTGLDEVIGNIEFINIDGINQTTPEMRIPNQDFSGTSDPIQAYTAGINKWTGLKDPYTNEKALGACNEVIRHYHEVFGGVMKMCSLIAGKNGFVKLPGCEMVPEGIIGYMKTLSNVGLLPTALTDVGGTPGNMVNSGLPVWFQLSNTVMNKSLSKEKFEDAVINGKDHGGLGIELYEINVREHADIILKYS